MVKPKKLTKRAKVARGAATTFGTLGYLSCLLQWVWLVILYMVLVAKSDVWNLLMYPTESSHAMPSMEFNIPEEISLVLGAVITFCVLILVLYIIFMTPKAVSKTGQQITQQTAKKAVPIVTHHKKISIKKEQQLTFKIGWIIKLILVLIPVIGSVFSHLSCLPVPYHIAIIVSLVLAGFSIILFLAQYTIVKLSKIPVSEVR